jgi:hypothetical protein
MRAGSAALAPFEKIGQGFLHDQVFFDVGGVHFLDNGFIYDPAEPKFIEEDDFFVVHHYA